MTSAEALERINNDELHILPDLPVELIQSVIHHAAQSGSLKNAVALRRASRFFDKQVTRSLALTRLDDIHNQAKKPWSRLPPPSYVRRLIQTCLGHTAWNDNPFAVNLRAVRAQLTSEVATINDSESVASDANAETYLLNTYEQCSEMRWVLQSLAQSTVPSDMTYVRPPPPFDVPGVVISVAIHNSLTSVYSAMLQRPNISMPAWSSLDCLRKSPLQIACDNSDVRAIRLLLATGIAVGHYPYSTCLNIETVQDNIEILRLLLESWHLVNINYMDVEYVCEDAAENNRFDVVDIFLSTHDHCRSDALRCRDAMCRAAVRYHNLEMVKRIITGEKGFISISAALSGLLEAVLQNNTACFAEILVHAEQLYMHRLGQFDLSLMLEGAEDSAEDSPEEDSCVTRLSLCYTIAQRGHLSMLNMLRERGLDLEEGNLGNITLITAAHYGRASIMRHLLSLSDSRSLHTRYQLRLRRSHGAWMPSAEIISLALDAAISQNHRETASLLVAAFPHSLVLNSSTLVTAVDSGHTGMVRFLLDRGVKPFDEPFNALLEGVFSQRAFLARQEARENKFEDLGLTTYWTLADPFPFRIEQKAREQWVPWREESLDAAIQRASDSAQHNPCQNQTAIDPTQD